ncbi:MAG: hypothetical protein VX460_08235 [Planctomycetota bacterium]|nr:hypothetical protein [Planctomycetota bacterium]
MADDKPEPIPRKSPKKGSGPSMREQIAARRRAELAAEASPAPEAAPRPAAPKAAPKPAAEAAPKAAPKAKPKAAPRARAAASKASTGERVARPTRSGAGRAGRTGATSSRRSRDGDEGGARRSRREKPEKKSSPVLLIAVGVLIVGGGAGAYFGGLFGGDPADASTGGEQAVTASGDQDTADSSAAGSDADDQASAAPDAGTANAPDGDAAPDQPDPAPAADEPAPKKKTGKLTDNSTDELRAMFAALEPFERPQAMSEAEWNELGQKADLLFVDAGRKSAAAERELSIDGKKEIYPLVINRYLQMDFESEEQVLGGKSAARVLTAVRGSKNDRFDIGWRTAGESEDGTFGDRELRQDLMIVINLHKSWSKVVADPAHWERIYIGEMYKEADEIMKESAENKLEDLDDLDLDDLDLDDIDG